MLKLKITQHHTYLDPLHLCAEGVEQLKENQSQRKDIHLVRIGVATDLRRQSQGQGNQATAYNYLQSKYHPCKFTCGSHSPVQSWKLQHKNIGELSNEHQGARSWSSAPLCCKAKCFILLNLMHRACPSSIKWNHLQLPSYTALKARKMNASCLNK